MGADIHIYAEKKLKDGSWSAYSTFPSVALRALCIDKPADYYSDHAWQAVTNRNYAFFAALAGVRGDGPEPRGLPEDVSPLVAEEFKDMGGDAHSASWYSAGDFLPIYLECMFPEDAVHLVGGHVSKAGLLGQHFGFNTWKSDVEHDYRFVFWFDN
jgi:hypothetical protein